MHIQPHTFLWITFLMFSWKCRKVSGSETTMKTWKNAVLDCYEHNSVLESNETVLKKYMSNHTEVSSIWVGGFEALLPWIEIRGCYNLPLACKNLEIDEKNAENLQICQIKCMERRYFAFNQKNERCVCFDEHDLVKKETENASFCQECKYRDGCTTYVVVYKVFDRPISSAGRDHDCLSYECEFNGAMPIFTTRECYIYCRSYCRDGRKAVGPDYQLFFQYRESCQEDLFTYPLLHDGNPVKLCNVSESHQSGIYIWVGVYRQRLYMDNSNEAVFQDFNQIAQYISLCYHFSMNGGLESTLNCSDKLPYICTPDTSMNVQKEPNNSYTSTPVCRSKDLKIGSTDNQSSGIIVGTVTSIFVVLVVGVIVVIIYRRRFNSKIPKVKDKRSEGDPPKNNIYTQENNSDRQYNNTDIQIGPNSFAKPLAGNNTQVMKAADDETEYSRIVSTVCDASNLTEKTIHCIANTGYNDILLKVDTKLNSNGNQQISNSLLDSMKSADYCLAKPITDSSELDPYTDNAAYDHLNSVKHQEKDSVNVYDHVPNIIDSDDTYDHSAINICKSDANNYDHFDVQN